MTLQEIFNKSVTGVLAQGGASMFGAACAYRGNDGRKCAAGQLLPDDVYDSSLNTIGIESVDAKLRLQVHAMFRKGGIELADVDVFMLVGKLQRLHDGFCNDRDFLNKFARHAIQAGREFGLDVSAVRLPQVRATRKLHD